MLNKAGYAIDRSGTNYYLNVSNQSYLITFIWALVFAIVGIFLIALIVLFIYKCLLNKNRQKPKEPAIIRYKENKYSFFNFFKKKDNVEERALINIMRKN